MLGTATYIATIEWQPTLLGIAALLTAFGGVISTIMAFRKSRSDDEQACLERLKEARAEAERLAAELHARKMAEPDTKRDHNGERG
jgi:hypothetical protein